MIGQEEGSIVALEGQYGQERGGDDKNGWENAVETMSALAKVKSEQMGRGLKMKTKQGKGERAYFWKSSENGEF